MLTALELEKYDKIQWILDFSGSKNLFDPYLNSYLTRASCLVKNTGKTSSAQDLQIYNDKIKEILQGPTSNTAAQPNMTERLKKHFECPICFNDMKTKIFSCTNDHLLCQKCFTKKCLSNCPLCRERLDKKNPRRNRSMEKLALDMNI